MSRLPKPLSPPQKDMKALREGDMGSDSLFCPQGEDIDLERLTKVRDSGQVVNKRSNIYSSWCF